MKIKLKERCHSCSGTGAYMGGRYCWTCGGRGWYHSEMNAPDPKWARECKQAQKEAEKRQRGAS